MDTDSVMLSEILTQNGYRCAHSGKWHIGSDYTAPRGFDPFFGTDWIEDEDTEYGRYLNEKGIAFPNRMEVQRGEKPPYRGVSGLSPEDFIEGYIANRALAMLDTIAKDEPFALWLSFVGPHWPLQIPAEYARMYNPSDIVLDGSYGQDPGKHPRHLIGASPGYCYLDISHLTERDLQACVAHYWGYVSLIDHCIGKVLHQFMLRGLLDETLVVFTADHGDMLGAHGLWNKGPMLTEDVNRVPLIMRHPHVIDPNSHTEYFASGADITPTILDLLDLPCPSGLDGASLLPCLDGKSISDCAVTGWYYEDWVRRDTRALRMGKWKLALYPHVGYSLYDLDADPHEMNDLSQDAGHASVLQDMRQRLEAWMLDHDDHLLEP